MNASPVPLPLADGRHIAVLDQGQGEALLLVHGFPLDHTMWQFQIPALAARYRVLAVDLPGFGASDAWPGEVVTMADFADDLAEVVQQKGLSSVTFCGLSMGGYIGWQFFERHRRFLSRLIQCDTKSDADSEEARTLRLQTAERVVGEGGMDQLVDGMQDRLFAAQTKSSQEDLVAETTRVMRRTRPQTIAASLRGMAARPSVSERLHAIDLPVLLLCGEHDVISPPTEMQRMARALPQATYVEVPEAGHMSPLEQPEFVNRSILAWLDGAPRPE